MLYFLGVLILIIAFMIFIVYNFMKIIKKLLDTIESITFLLKIEDTSQNEVEDRELVEEVNDIWQTDQRYTDIFEMDNEALKNIDINPDSIITWYHKEKTENYN